jgi:hypothetical protein
MIRSRHLRPSTIAIVAMIVVALFTGACTGDGKRGEIFREIVVGSGETISLGAPLPAEVQPLLQPIGGDGYSLRPGAFADAESIVVRLAPYGVVRSIAFTYAPGKGYDDLVASYRDDLGPPARLTGSPADMHQTARWEDGRTAFEIIRSGGRVGSALYDLASSS